MNLQTQMWGMQIPELQRRRISIFTQEKISNMPDVLSCITCLFSGWRSNKGCYVYEKVSSKANCFQGKISVMELESFSAVKRLRFDHEANSQLMLTCFGLLLFVFCQGINLHLFSFFRLSCGPRLLSWHFECGRYRMTLILGLDILGMYPVCLL